MIEEFIPGKWYRYTGKTRMQYWNTSGKMDFVLDNLPHKCKEGGFQRASFDDNKEDYAWYWASGIELWEEVSGKINWQEVIEG